MAVRSSEVISEIRDWVFNVVTCGEVRLREREEERAPGWEQDLVLLRDGLMASKRSECKVMVNILILKRFGG